MKEWKTLVIYGYHPEEEFALEVGQKLEKERLPDTLVLRYCGRSDADDRQPSLVKFVDENRPTCYAIDLHDAGKAAYEDFSQGMRIKGSFFCTHSNRALPTRMGNGIRDFLESEFPGEPYASPLIHAPYYSLRKPVAYSIWTLEFYPQFATLTEEIGFTKALIKFLNSTS